MNTNLTILLITIVVGLTIVAAVYFSQYKKALYEREITHWKTKYEASCEVYNKLIDSISKTLEINNKPKT